MAKPVYRIQIGAKGGARWGGSQIRKELDAYFKNGYKVKVTVGDVELKGLQDVIKTQKESIKISKKSVDINKMQEALSKSLSLQRKRREKDELAQAKAINKHLDDEYNKRLKLSEVAQKVRQQAQIEVSSLDKKISGMSTEAYGKFSNSLGKIRTGLVFLHGDDDKVIEKFSKIQEKLKVLNNEISLFESATKTRKKASDISADFERKIEALPRKVRYEYSGLIQDIKDGFSSLVEAPDKDVGRNFEAIIKKVEEFNANLKSLEAKSKVDLSRSRAGISEEKFYQYIDSIGPKARKQFEESIDAIRKGFASLEFLPDSEVEDTIKRINIEVEKLKVNIKEFNNLHPDSSISRSAQLALGQFEQYIQNLKPSAVKQYSDVIQNIKDSFSNIIDGGLSAEDLKKSFADVNSKVKEFKGTMKVLGAEGGNIFTHLHNKAKSFVAYLISSTATLAIYRTLQNIVRHIFELDKALTNLRIVTGKTAQETSELLKTYNQLAQSLGTTTSEVAKGAVEWQRQGYSLAETNELIKNSTVLSVVGFLDSAEAAQLLTSAIKGYKLEARDASRIVDKLTAIDMEAAVSAGGLAEAMSRTANSARLAGVNMDTLLGYLAAVGEVTQRDMATVGETFKTLFARYSNVKLGNLMDEESGEALNDFEKALSKVGIKLRNTEEEFRNFDDVLKEIVSNYDTFTDVEKSAIASTLGGTRQRENVLVLFENYDRAMKYATASTQSAGTAMEKYEMYQESIEAKQNRLTAAMEKFAQSLKASGIIAFFMDFGTFIMNTLSDIPPFIKNLLLASTLMITVSSAVNAIKLSPLGAVFSDMGTKIKSLFTTIVKLPQAFAAAKAGAVSFGAALKALNISPVFLALSAITLIGATAVTIIQSASKSVKKLSEEIQGLESQIGELDKELEKISSRISELNRQDSLSFVEEQELENLKNQNEYLQARYDILQRTLELTERQKNEAIRKDLDKGYVWTPIYDEQGTVIGEEDIPYEEHIERLSQEYVKLMSMMGKYSQMSVTEQRDFDARVANVTEEFQKYALMYSDAADKITIFDDESKALYDRFSGMAVKINNILSGKVLDNYIPENIEKAYTRLSALVRLWEETGDKLYLEKAGSFIEETLATDKQFNDFVLMARESGTIADYSVTSILSLIKSFVSFERAAGRTKGAVKDFNTSLSELSKLTAGAKNVSSLLETFSKDGYVAADSLSNLDDSIKKLDSFENFANVLSNSSSTLAEARAATGSLIDEYIRWSGVLEGLSEDNVGLVEAQLRSIGVTNAERIVSERFTAQKLDAKVASLGLAEAEWEVVESTLKEAGATKQAIASLKEYRQEKVYTQFASTNFVSASSTVIESLLGQAKAAGIAAKNIEALNKLYSYKTRLESGAITDFYVYQAMVAQIEEIGKQLKESTKDIESFTLPDININLSGSSVERVERYVANIERFREATYRLSELQKEIETKNIKMSLVDEDDVDALRSYTVELVSLYKMQQEALHILNEERDSAIHQGLERLRSLGFKAFYDDVTNSLFIENLELINSLGSGMDTKKANEFRKEIEKLIDDLNKWNQENITGSQEWLRIQKTIIDLLNSQREKERAYLENQKNSLNELVDLTKDMIKHEMEGHIEALEKAADQYQKIIDLKKKSLELSQRERSYQEDISQKNTEIQKLQAQIDALALDDSREAQVKRATLIEQMASLQKELSDKQRDYYIENTQDALDNEASAYQKSTDSKIESIRKFLNDNLALTNAAISRIEKEGNSLFNKLLQYGQTYANKTRLEIVKMWEEAKKAAHEYGSVSKAVTAVDSRLELLDGDTGSSQSEIKAIVTQMKLNSAKWHTSDPATRKQLEEQNRILASQIKVNGISPTYNNNAGEWLLNGKRLYEIYHTGTPSAGMLPTPNQKELWALIEKGEAVLTQKQQDGLLNFIKKFAPQTKLVQGISAAFSSFMGKQSASSAPVVNVDGSVTVNGYADEHVLDIIRKHPREVAEQVSKAIMNNA